jgi:serine/threonine protein kinase
MRRYDAAMLLMVGLVCALAGCSSDRSLHLTQWEVTREGAPPTPVTLPVHLPASVVPERPGRYALHARVSLPPALRARRLHLVVPEVAAVVEARVDGVLATDLGWADASGYRRRGPQEWEIPAAATTDGVLDLELRVNHTWTQSAWWGTVPRLLPLEASDVDARLIIVFNLFVIFAGLVALGQIGLTSVMVYVVDRRRRQYLWFGLQALLACYFPIWLLGWSQRLFGVYDVPLLAITLVIATTASVQFTHIFFRLAPPWRGLWPTCALVCAIAASLHGPFTATGWAGVPTVLFLLATLSYQVLACARLVVRGVEGANLSARYSLASWLTLMITCTPDLLYWLGVGDLLGGVRLASVGLAASGLLLSLRLSQEHITSLGRSDSLNVELAGRVAQLTQRGTEIEKLNTELRRQIEDRAGQMYAALALAAGEPASAPQLIAGDLVQGRYRVVRPLGSGGMGRVYEVERVADGARLALKLTREVDPAALARLAREAQMASTVSHPHVVGILDVDVASSGFIYLIMELVEGPSLHELRKQFGDPAWAVPVLQQIASGLAALHAAGIVHRDLKPGNVLMTHEGLVKITDFGIALADAKHVKLPRLDTNVASEGGDSLTGALAAMPLEARDVRLRVALDHDRDADAPPDTLAQSILTRTGVLPGTPAYIAPELVDGRERLSPAADLFAFGVIAYELIADRRPWLEAPVLSLVEGRPVPVPQSIRDWWNACPIPVAAALDACLSFEPLDRPTAQKLAILLADVGKTVTEAADPPPLASQHIENIDK